jgi:anti-anti-sigma factor
MGVETTHRYIPRGFAVEVHERPGVVVLAPVGELDVATAPTLLEVAEEAHAGRSIELDCAGVTFMDSNGIRALLELVDRASANGGKLRICNVQSEARRVLEITGLLERLPIVAG